MNEISFKDACIIMEFLKQHEKNIPLTMKVLGFEVIPNTTTFICNPDNHILENVKQMNEIESKNIELINYIQQHMHTELKITKMLGARLDD